MWYAGAGVGCSNRMGSVEGDPPTASALCSEAGLAGLPSVVLLHFGQRTVKGLAGYFSSSIFKRVEHFSQIMIMELFEKALKKVQLLNQAHHPTLLRKGA